ncbi:putative isomerase YbhE [Sistotremastrum niveocremeum HHB9708]|uniref:Putative isomerase YbhE n=2 Tax=Sistotremastraceae TaxID=3402574 RepID=A0A164PYB8_9AGAM|nr:putative isomerase YbhE [Sistotremastrum niveocremeum HHB9708]KZT33332.1 putative isomerase YbhE [Sistotremastrum suecicum HHB10207 ss-3]
MVSFTILAGGYTSVITSFLFQSSPPSLTVQGTSPAGTNPSWIAQSPINPNVLYATNENSYGQLLTFNIGSGGALTQVSTVYTGGNGPAFATPLPDGQTIAALNYNSGNAEFFPLSSDLVHFANSNPPLISFTANGGQSHPHFLARYDPEMFIADLGADKVWRMSNSTGTWAINGYIPQPSGSGPRRIAISGTTMYVLHEDANTLTQQCIPCSPTTTTAPIVSSLPITPAGATTSQYGAGELLMPNPNSQYPTQYIYASNRLNNGNPDPRGDSIAIFSTNPLQLVTQVFTGLNQIRGMGIGGPNNEYIIAAGLTGGGVAVYERSQGGANLTLLARSTDTNAQQRSSFVWL